MSVSRVPQFDVFENISILQLYRVSPLGVFGMFVNGLTYGAFLGMGAVYASDIGLSGKDISLFMGSLILGGFLFQYPLGWMSDTFDPIRVILLSSIGGMLSVIGGFALWRYPQRSVVNTEEQGDFVVMVASPMTATLNPDVALDEIEDAVEEDAADIISSFEDLVSNLETAEEKEDSNLD